MPFLYAAMSDSSSSDGSKGGEGDSESEEESDSDEDGKKEEPVFGQETRCNLTRDAGESTPYTSGNTCMCTARVLS
jgi:hypothetical protein